MATAILSPAQELHNLFFPIDQQQQLELEKNIPLTVLRQKYEGALKKNPRDARIIVSNIVQELNEGGYFHRSPDEVLTSFEHPAETEQNLSSTSQETFETLAPQGQTLQDFLPKKSESSGGGVTSAKELADQTLKKTIKSSVREEFEKLLATTPQDRLPDAIEGFYHTHFSAAGVLERQYEELQKQTRKMYEKKKTIEEFARHEAPLEEEKKERVEKLKATQSPERIRPEDTYLKAQRNIEIQNILDLRKDAEARNIKKVTGKIFDDGGIFDAEWNRRRGNRALESVLSKLNLSFTQLTESFEEGASIAAITSMETQQLSSEPQIVPQSPTFSSGNTGGGNNMGSQIANRVGNYAKRKAKRKAEEELLAQGGKQALGAAVRQAGAGIISLLGGPEVAIGILIAILVFIVIFIIIMIIISIVGGNNNNNPPNPPPIPTGSSVHPTPPFYPTDYRTAIRQKFGIDIVGMYGYEYKWAWEKLWDVSNTQFDYLISKVPCLSMDSGGGTAYTYWINGHRCVHIHIHHFPDLAGFDVIFTHELTHAINFANPESLTHWSELPKAIAQDRPYSSPSFLNGWVTLYSYYGCIYNPPIPYNIGEDYAEMVAYYLNKNVGMRTACGWGPWPYANGMHPYHYGLAQKILGPY